MHRVSSRAVWEWRVSARRAMPNERQNEKLPPTKSLAVSIDDATHATQYVIASHHVESILNEVRWNEFSNSIVAAQHTHTHTDGGMMKHFQQSISKANSLVTAHVTIDLNSGPSFVADRPTEVLWKKVYAFIRSLRIHWQTLSFPRCVCESAFLSLLYCVLRRLLKTIWMMTMNGQQNVRTNNIFCIHDAPTPHTS